MNRREKDPLQRRLEITNWAILAALIAASLLFADLRFSLGILCGGLISIVNFHWLYHNLLTIFADHLTRAKTAILTRYSLRLALTAVVLYLVISGGHVNVIGLVIGLSVVIINIVLTTVLVLAKKICFEEVR
ncbi:MAG: ATP synthase subunit I [Syntrophales bacterium]